MIRLELRTLFSRKVENPDKPGEYMMLIFYFDDLSGKYYKQLISFTKENKSTAFVEVPKELIENYEIQNKEKIFKELEG